MSCTHANARLPYLRNPQNPTFLRTTIKKSYSGALKRSVTCSPGNLYTTPGPEPQPGSSAAKLRVATARRPKAHCMEIRPLLATQASVLGPRMLPPQIGPRNSCLKANFSPSTLLHTGLGGMKRNPKPGQRVYSLGVEEASTTKSWNFEPCFCAAKLPPLKPPKLAKHPKPKLQSLACPRKPGNLTIKQI